MIRKHWKKVVTIFIGILLIGDIAASFFFYNLAIKRGPKEFLEENADLEVAAESLDEMLDGEWREWVATQDFEEIEMKSRDGLELIGYYLPAKKPTDKLVVFTHGYLGHAKQMGLFGQYYYEELGYNIFMADARGHGDSEGDYYGFGWPDRLDLIDWTNLLVNKLGNDTQVVYHGLSMGAATVLMASGEKELPDQVKAIVADSAYTSVYDLFAYQMKRMFKLPAFPILDSTSLVTKIKAGYWLREADAQKEVEVTDVPILYIHGKGDTFVPTKLAQELYESTNSEAELMLVDGANHGESFVLEKEVYKERLNHFLSNYIE
ncbi:alpha/beta hydrolase [Bacillus sp. SD088]|uniref:alpha/beta hydrolase n=1 Tax=Bacillus sp. SD088 TaxID=2782012 RepID=UPI001A9688C4|nr:alpha/beta hydrolase [Bacillus sp. SD088]MBO0993722.1 alpha/beta hydrolase [Bacillus sp. SD088]